MGDSARGWGNGGGRLQKGTGRYSGLGLFLRLYKRGSRVEALGSASHGGMGMRRLRPQPSGA